MNKLNNKMKVKVLTEEAINLPKGAVLSKDGIRYILKGRSYPYLTGKETVSISLTSEELIQANQLSEKLGFSSDSD